MTWLIVILVVAGIGGILGYFNSGNSEGAVAGAAGAGMGCGYLILQIFLALLGFWVIFKLGSWLFN